MSGPAANTRKNPEPSLQKKENDQALRDADPELKKDLEAADKEAAGAGTADDGDYKPAQETDEGQDLPEGTELEPEDEEIIQ